jgi:phage terminase small subunit
VVKKTTAKLTAKQRRFCEEYVVDLNATQAAIRAGYSRKTAREIGRQNLTKLDIQQHVQKLMDERSARTEITADQVLRQLAAIAFASITDYLSFRPDGVEIKDSTQISPEKVAAVARVSEYVTKHGRRSVRLGMHNKIHALELLGKHLKLFTEKVEAHLTLAQAIHEAMSDEGSDN